MRGRDPEEPRCAWCDARCGNANELAVHEAECQPVNVAADEADGARAHRAGLPITACPRPVNTWPWIRWRAGWTAAADMARAAA